MKVYEVFIIDNWNNIYLIGWYKDLDDAIEGINDHITNDKYKLEKGDLKEYPSTFNNCFDTSVYDIYQSKNSDDEIDYEDDIQIRGFIFNSLELIKEIIK